MRDLTGFDPYAAVAKHIEGQMRQEMKQAELLTTRRDRMEAAAIQAHKRELAERLELSTILYHQYRTTPRSNDDDGE